MPLLSRRFVRRRGPAAAVAGPDHETVPADREPAK